MKENVKIVLLSFSTVFSLVALLYLMGNKVEGGMIRSANEERLKAIAEKEVYARRMVYLKGYIYNREKIIKVQSNRSVVLEDIILALPINQIRKKRRTR